MTDTQMSQSDTYKEDKERLEKELERWSHLSIEHLKEELTKSYWETARSDVLHKSLMRQLDDIMVNNSNHVGELQLQLLFCKNDMKLRLEYADRKYEKLEHISGEVQNDMTRAIEEMTKALSDK